MIDKYKNYLTSNKWKVKRYQKLFEQKYTCEKCGCDHNLEVHHKHYNNIFNESQEDLQVLCNVCHDMTHNAQDKATQILNILTKSVRL